MSQHWIVVVSKVSPYTCYGLASNAYLNRKTERHMRHAIDLTPITTLEIHFNWLHLTYWPFMKPLSLFWNIHSVIYCVRAFLKHLLKNISAISTICDDVSILRFRYMLRSNPERSGGQDLFFSHSSCSCCWLSLRDLWWDQPISHSLIFALLLSLILPIFVRENAYCIIGTARWADLSTRHPIKPSPKGSA